MTFAGALRERYVPLRKPTILSHAFPFNLAFAFSSLVSLLLVLFLRGKLLCSGMCAAQSLNKKTFLKLSSNVKFILKSMERKKQTKTLLKTNEELF
jgi:hypothetical protein